MITAKIVADYFISHLPEDYVPYWDFNILVSDTPKDSSAASIAASALLALAQLVKDKTVTMRYERIASKILNSLTKNYLTTLTPHHVGDMSHQIPRDILSFAVQTLNRTATIVFSYSPYREYVCVFKKQS